MRNQINENGVMPFTDIIIGYKENSRSKYISMTIRGGLMHVHCDIHNAFDIRKARLLAKALDIPIFVFEDVERELNL